MVEYYVEPAGADVNLGTAPGAGNAWLTVKYALETAGVPGLVAGDNVWVRRTHNEIPGADIACAFDGTANSPISVIGWTRAEEGAGSGVWANGSTEINDVAGLEMDREKHTGRRVKQDTDGKWYLITYIPYIAQPVAPIKLAFVDSNPDTITDTDARFVKQDIKAGDKIRITGSTTNDGTYTIAGVVAGTITLVGGDTLNAENAIDGTKIQVYDRFIIDREYAGTDTGAFTIQKDDDFDSRAAAGIAAGWDGDADDLPVIDFNDGDFELLFSRSLFHVLKNLEIKDSADSDGIVSNYQSQSISITGCLLKQSLQDNPILVVRDMFIYLERVIIEGSGAGGTQVGLHGKSVGFDSHLKDCAIFNCGDHGIKEPGFLLLENVNIGVEIANADDDIVLNKFGRKCIGRDVKLGGNNGYILINEGAIGFYASFENYGKILGDHKTWFPGGTSEKAATDGGGTRPNQRAGGNANVIEITPNIANYEFIPDWAITIFSHEFEVDTTARTWRYYIQNDACGILAATNLWLKLEYIVQYDDTSEYVITEVISDETVANRANNNDWTQYIEVPNITPATTSKVRIKCFVSKHSAAGHIYIDPKVANP